MTTKQHFKNDYVEIYLKNNILYVVFGEKTCITPEKASIIVQERVRLVGDNSYPTLVDCRKGQSIDKESRKIFASVEAMRNVSAGAIIFKSAIHRMFINAYLWFDNPKLPVNVFTSEQKAVDWLRTYQ